MAQNDKIQAIVKAQIPPQRIYKKCKLLGRK